MNSYKFWISMKRISLALHMSHTSGYLNFPKRISILNHLYSHFIVSIITETVEKIDQTKCTIPTRMQPVIISVALFKVTM